MLLFSNRNAAILWIPAQDIITAMTTIKHLSVLRGALKVL